MTETAWYEDESMPETAYDVNRMLGLLPGSFVAHMIGEFDVVGHGKTEEAAKADWRRQMRERGQ